MSIEIEAVYEDGVLKPKHPLPLQEHQRVKVVVRDEGSIAKRTYGVIGWQGDADMVRRIANDPDFGVAESP